MEMNYQYSADFYTWMAFCALPTFGFIVTILKRDSRPWAKKAIENADGDPHHVDLTFLVTLITGWLLSYAMFASLGLALFEGKDTLNVFIQCGAGVAVMWGVNKIEKIKNSRDNAKE